VLVILLLVVVLAFGFWVLVLLGEDRNVAVVWEGVGCGLFFVVGVLLLGFWCCGRKWGRRAAG